MLPACACGHICVCVWSDVGVLCLYYVYGRECKSVCVCRALSPIYLQNGYVWPILPDFLALGKQTASVCVLFQNGGDCWYLKEIWADLCLIYAVCLFDIDHKR